MSFPPFFVFDSFDIDLLHGFFVLSNVLLFGDGFPARVVSPPVT